MEKWRIRHLIVDDRVNEIIKMIFELVYCGYSVDDIIKQLNEARFSTPEEYASTGFIRVNKREKKKEWTYKMLLRILQNRIYTGCLEHGKRVWMETEEGKKQVTQEEVLLVVLIGIS
ncbi:MAG: recombinase family protein [Eubacteriales bacterium]